MVGRCFAGLGKARFGNFFQHSTPLGTFHMIRREITEKMKRWAMHQTVLSKARPNMRGWSDFGNTAGHDTTYTGHLGEAVVWCEWPHWRFFNRGAYDFLTSSGKPVNARTRTKTKQPQENDCQVMPAFMVSADPRLTYILVCVLNDLSSGWLVGWIPAREFVERAVFQKEGELAHSGMIHKCDAWTIEIADTYDMATFCP